MLSFFFFFKEASIVEPIQLFLREPCQLLFSFRFRIGEQRFLLAFPSHSKFLGVHTSSRYKCYFTCHCLSGSEPKSAIVVVACHSLGCNPGHVRLAHRRYSWLLQSLLRHRLINRSTKTRTLWPKDGMDCCCRWNKHRVILYDRGDVFGPFVCSVFFASVRRTCDQSQS